MTANERILVHSLRSDAGFFYTFAFPTEGKVHPRCWKHRRFSRDKLVTRTRWLLVPFASRGQRPIDVEGNCCWKSEHDEEAWRPCDPHPHSRGGEGRVKRTRADTYTIFPQRTSAPTWGGLTSSGPGPLVPFSTPEFMFTTRDLSRRPKTKSVED